MQALTGLEPGERYRVDMYMMCWLQNAELALLDHSDGLLPDSALQPYHAAIAGHLRSPGGTQWWSERKSWFTKGGQTAFDKILHDETLSGLGARVVLDHQ